MEELVAEIIEELYKNKNIFVSAYQSNPNKVFSKVVLHMKVVPINLRAILDSFFIELTTNKPDSYVA